MNQVQRAIHIRTGQRAAADAIDQWLARHGAAITPFGDVYAACAHLLQHYDLVPDLVFLGADWLVDDELSLIAYVRQTWPRAGVVVYGAGSVTPRVDLLPMMHAVRVEDGLATLLNDPPQVLLQRLLARAATLTPAGGAHTRMRAGPGMHAGQGADAVPERPAESETSAKSKESAGPAQSGPDLDELLTQLSAEELSALLDEGEEDRRR